MSETCKEGKVAQAAVQGSWAAIDAKQPVQSVTTGTIPTISQKRHNFPDSNLSR